MIRAKKMTIQLELDFLPSYVHTAIADLRAFAVAVSRSSFKQGYILRYRKMECQASDLKTYAFLHGYIDFNEWDYLSSLMDESSFIFWSV